MQKYNHTISSIRKFKVNYKTEAAEGDGVAKSFLSQLQEELVKTGEKLTKVSGVDAEEERPLFVEVGESGSVVPILDCKNSIWKKKLMISIGRIMALSLMNNWIFPLRLSRPFIKLILKREVS